MKNPGIVYILGAGASANALPVVGEMIERFQIFYLATFLSGIVNPQKNDTQSNVENRPERLITELKTLLIELKTKRSIDTYAKELYIKKATGRLDTLKALLGTYLTFEEMFSDDEMRAFFEEHFPGHTNADALNDERESIGLLSSLNTELKNKLNQPGNSEPEYIDELSCLKYLYKYNASGQGYQNNKIKIDQRYINFLIDVMEEVDSFPSKIKFFSWNYDSQFLHAVTNLDFKITYKGEATEFPFLKRLNGVAAQKKINPATISNGMKTAEKINECFDCFWRLSHQENLLVKFAFEQDQGFEKSDISSHIDGFDSVSDLVIIGYSFPLSNRNIDKHFFEEILKKINYTRDKVTNLKIYIQVPPSSDANNDQFTISKAKVTAIINSIIPELELSSDGNELSHTRKVSSPWIEADLIVPGITRTPPSDVFETLKIKFYRQWDPVNFYIPQSF